MLIKEYISLAIAEFKLVYTDNLRGAASKL
jgi:hypothetical protein